jgi:hypothetical protein
VTCYGKALPLIFFTKDLNAVDQIKIKRLGWEGAIIRTEDERVPKIFFLENSITKDQ